MIWENNAAFIRQHNREAASGFHSYTLKMNQFGDLVILKSIEKQFQYSFFSSSDESRVQTANEWMETKFNEESCWSNIFS